MNIFQIARALGADDLTSPTIPFTPLSGSLTPMPSEVVSGPSILLKTNVVSLKIGEKATVEVIIFTNKQEIKSYKFKIKYDKTALKVLDADNNVVGTQIYYQNTFFDQRANTVNDQGEILFEAGSDVGTTTITSRVVASFEVEALKEGSYQMELVRNDSKMINYLNTDILQGVNSIVLNVSNQVIVTTKVPSGSITPSDITPRTGFLDDMGYTNAVIIGTLLIISGIYLFKKKKKNDLF